MGRCRCRARRHRCRTAIAPVLIRNNRRCSREQILNESLFALVRNKFLDEQWSPGQIKGRLALKLGASLPLICVKILDADQEEPCSHRTIVLASLFTGLTEIAALDFHSAANVGVVRFSLSVAYES